MMIIICLSTYWRSEFTRVRICLCMDFLMDRATFQHSLSLFVKGIFINLFEFIFTLFYTNLLRSYQLAICILQSFVFCSKLFDKLPKSVFTKHKTSTFFLQLQALLIMAYLLLKALIIIRFCRSNIFWKNKVKIGHLNIYL